MSLQVSLGGGKEGGWIGGTVMGKRRAVLGRTEGFLDRIF
jgi:hypothetical protein